MHYSIRIPCLGDLTFISLCGLKVETFHRKYVSLRLLKSEHDAKKSNTLPCYGINIRSFTPVIPKLGGAHRSGARNIESSAVKNYGNAPKLNYQLTKFSLYLLTLQNP
jgi:hypothetical protein